MARGSRKANSVTTIYLLNEEVPMIINLKPIHAFEQLDIIEAEKDIVKKAMLLQQFGAKAPLNYILSLNFNQNIKLELPEGMPPLDTKDMDAHTHPDLMGMLGGGVQRLRNCMVGVKISKVKKEQIFYDVLINCPMKDAEILCSAKDRALEELYPSIDKQLVGGVFPNYVSE